MNSSKYIFIINTFILLQCLETTQQHSYKANPLYSLYNTNLQHPLKTRNNNQPWLPKKISFSFHTARAEGRIYGKYVVCSIRKSMNETKYNMLAAANVVCYICLLTKRLKNKNDKTPYWAQNLQRKKKLNVFIIHINSCMLRNDILLILVLYIHS